MARSGRMNLSEVIDNLDFDDPMAEGSDDDLDMDNYDDYDSDISGGIIELIYKVLKL
jgi:hypothetical protein